MKWFFNSIKFLLSNEQTFTISYNDDLMRERTEVVTIKNQRRAGWILILVPSFAALMIFVSSIFIWKTYDQKTTTENLSSMTAEVEARVWAKINASNNPIKVLSAKTTRALPNLKITSASSPIKVKTDPIAAFIPPSRVRLKFLPNRLTPFQIVVQKSFFEITRDNMMTLSFNLLNTGDNLIDGRYKASLTVINSKGEEEQIPSKSKNFSMRNLKPAMLSFAAPTAPFQKIKMIRLVVHSSDCTGSHDCETVAFKDLSADLNLSRQLKRKNTSAQGSQIFNQTTQ